MISLTWKCIIMSSMSGKEAFKALLLVVVGKSLGGKCKCWFFCPRSSMKILISQLASRENKSSCTSCELKPFFSKVRLSACSCPFGFRDQSQWAVAHFRVRLAHFSKESEHLPCAHVPVMPSGLQRWGRCGRRPQRVFSIGKKRYMCPKLWSKWTEESLRGAGRGLGKLTTWSIASSWAIGNGFMSSTQDLKVRMGFGLWRCHWKTVLVRRNTQKRHSGYVWGKCKKFCLVEDFKKPIIKHNVGKLIGVRSWRTFNTGVRNLGFILFSSFQTLTKCFNLRSDY